MKDNEIIARVLSGETQAFAEIVRRYQRSIMFLMIKYMGIVEAAEDVTQETFLKAFNALKTCKDPNKFRAWLFTIAVNTAKNKIRSRKDHEEFDEFETPVEEPYKPEVDQDLVKFINYHVDRLPPKQKLAFTLRIFEELAFKDIAEIMNCGYDTAKANYRHALLRIKGMVHGQ